jgi:Spy/CpxP family protein refolding chaperone
MTKSFSVLAAVALLCMLALPLAAQSVAYESAAASARSGSADYILTHPRALSKFLHLSSDQNTQLQALWTTLQTSDDALRQARGPLCDQLRTDLTANAGAATVGTDSINLFTNKEGIRTARQTFDTAFSAILTPDQLTKYNGLKQIAHLDNGPGTDILGECPPASS